MPMSTHPGLAHLEVWPGSGAKITDSATLQKKSTGLFEKATTIIYLKFDLGECTNLNLIQIQIHKYCFPHLDSLIIPWRSWFFAKFWQNHFTTDFMSFSAQQTKMTPTALLRKPSGNTQQTSSPWWCRSCRLKLHREKWKVAEVHQFGDHQLQGRKHCNSSISLLCTKSTGAGIHLERHLAYTHAFERITSISSYMMITFCTSWRPNDQQSFAAHNIIRICGWSIYQCHLTACCFNIGFPSILD